MAKKDDLSERFMNAGIAFIFAQVVAGIIAAGTNFSALGLIVAGFVDVVMIAAIMLYVVKGK